MLPTTNESINELQSLIADMKNVLKKYPNLEHEFTICDPEWFEVFVKQPTPQRKHNYPKRYEKERGNWKRSFYKNTPKNIVAEVFSNRKKKNYSVAELILGKKKRDE